MNEGDTTIGVVLIFCISIWPFICGLWIGWVTRGRWQHGGWVGILPKILRDRIEVIEE